ncbi:GBF-interacting protein 1 isoform X1 [Daucus carota subsp. sativus]|uniref:GBF-interacting protein 1 isoform X1 n=1 Tax=Daucus carota subsp. sativus TaxID=79200 RepID=UPI0007F0260B|nr:PREDICTED: GBF-interacting protein 1-like isoform X2 [Daucus carota subsp. sativus]
MSNGGGRFVIPAKVKKVIQNIKEISGNHDDEEVYYMLKECNMDPNETAQQLLSQDSFREVRRKRDRRKENVKESAGSRWKPGMQDQGSRGERGNHSSRYITHDVGGAGKNFVSIKENGTSHVSVDKVAIPTQSNSQDVKNKEVTHASSNVDVDAYAAVTSESKSVGHAVHAASGFTELNDPLQSKSTADENNTYTKVSSGVGSLSFMHETISNISPVVHKDQHSESFEAVASTHSHPTGILPLIEFGGQSPVVIGPQKVGPNKEWKPKPNPSLPEGAESADTTLMLEVPAIRTESEGQVANQATFGLVKKLEETCISESQQVIIPKHIHIPEVEKLGFIFGSFDANFGLSTSNPVCPENEKSSPIPETPEGMEENVDQKSNHDELTSVEEEDNYPAPPEVSGSLISDAHDVSSRVVTEYSESKQETDLPPGYQQYSTVHAYPNFGFGIMPPIFGSQVLPTESNKSQAHDAPRLPGFVVQQPYDLNSYYAQFYRSGVDNEGRLSSFYEPGVPTKVNGNVTMAPAETFQSTQEGGDTSIHPTTASTPPVTHAAGAVPSSVAATQQAIPVFGQPAGLHLPHYPNYIPYHYIPFYVPPQALHHYLSTGVLPPPQPQAGSGHPAPVPANKFPLPQYKPGTTTANTNNVAAPGSYGSYGSTPASFSASSATTTGHSSSSEDLLAPQLKENNLFIAGQQSEGPGLWFAAPGRDISGLQANSFYNLPQAQMAFPATQVSHGNFAGMYHPAQPVTGAAVHPLLQQSQAMAGPIDLNGPAPSVYQPTQPAPINWPKNY